MKILVIAAIVISSVVMITSISFFTIPDTRLHCTFCQEIPSPGQPLEITDVSIEPTTVSLGTSFLIYADVFNPNPYSIYVNNGCVSSISATFDKNVETKKGISCFAISKQEIQSLQKARIRGPSIGTVYNASSVGETNATIVISYVATGSVGNVTASKNFTIYPPSMPPAKPSLEDQLGLASYDSIQNRIVDVIAIQMVQPPNPGGPVIELTLKNIGMVPITSLNATLRLNSNYTFDFDNVTSSTPLISRYSVSSTQILIGGGFRTELTYPLTISGIANDMPFRYSVNVTIT